MKKSLMPKKLSWKITFIIGAMILIVAGGVAAYMQTRIIAEIERYSRANFESHIIDTADKCNLAFLDTVHRSESMKIFLESNFDIAEYKADAENYFDNNIRPIMNNFVCNVIENAEFVSAAYFAVHPDLAGYPFVCEIYFEKTDDGIEEP